ncbi:GNAT family N-acetyltransferase [Actibacterium sp. MT2.3-13A]|uniref:GNAT family N-acetyltransferase n=1 Tax=Actibacterium sp. MT2.3-13A TaxID=2828332 RepID=UPI001BAB1A4C|nr:GNAT family N-acetyltransferase [Actibacterium sp. MT2.3-13A]
MTALHLARPENIDRLLPLAAAFHAEMGIAADDDHRRRALGPLLEGSPFGAIYLVGPIRAPIGYVVLTFGWSVEYGGMDAFVDELYVRPGVRGRGLALEALTGLRDMLRSAGIVGLHLEVDRDDAATQRLYQRAGFRLHERYVLMTQIF